MTKKKILWLICMLMVPLIAGQWYLKYVWVQLEYSGMEHFCWLSLLYIPIYTLVIKNNNRWVFGLLMWLNWFGLLFLLGYLSGMGDFWLSIDLWLNIILTIWLWSQKRKGTLLK